MAIYIMNKWEGKIQIKLETDIKHERKFQKNLNRWEQLEKTKRWKKIKKTICTCWKFIVIILFISHVPSLSVLFTYVHIFFPFFHIWSFTCYLYDIVQNKRKTKKISPYCPCYVTFSFRFNKLLFSFFNYCWIILFIAQSIQLLLSQYNYCQVNILLLS